MQRELGGWDCAACFHVPEIFILNTLAQAGISRFRYLIRTLNYSVSTRAAEELEDDHLTVLDLENIILTGQVAARQRDSRTREIKYVIKGITLAGDSAETVVKAGFTGKLFVITVYLC